MSLEPQWFCGRTRGAVRACSVGAPVSSPLGVIAAKRLSVLHIGPSLVRSDESLLGQDESFNC